LHLHLDPHGRNMRNFFDRGHLIGLKIQLG
jgi:hypothetical protein